MVIGKGKAGILVKGVQFKKGEALSTWEPNCRKTTAVRQDCGSSSDNGWVGWDLKQQWHQVYYTVRSIQVPRTTHNALRMSIVLVDTERRTQAFKNT